MQYGAILCDPPWRFITFSRKTAVPQRSGVDPYSTMTVDELSALDVGALAASDCALFMWAVGSHVDMAIDIGKRWGFKYVTDAFVWNKGRIGMGYWSRKQVETCYLFTRGKPRRQSKGVPQLITSPRREHSRKPEEIYERIERLVSGPYVEMFARQRRPGWEQAFSNEPDHFQAQARSIPCPPSAHANVAAGKPVTTTSISAADLR